MASRHLINEDGKPFADEELAKLTKELDSLNKEGRTQFRDANAHAVAQHPATKILIVAGPGTGKSTIFKQRALFWLGRDPEAKILALSFVRKLVADLNSDITNDKTLTEQQKKQVDVFTLHKYARSVVEQNRGTREWKFRPHFRIIGQSWEAMVWHDVLLVANQKNSELYCWDAFERQLHNDEFDQSSEWKEVKDSYFTLCQLYNAAGFSDLILRGKDALAENPALNQHQLFIVDEYQDFNNAEKHLLDQITHVTMGSLIVGDDDQVLYETLKSGKPSLIRALYKDTDIVNAMLAFCGRCDFHITAAASHFIKKAADPDSIKKIYLPIGDADKSLKVRIVGCAQPSAAVDYIRKFIEDHNDSIEKRRGELASGEAKDAYLLILSPTRAADFYKLHGAREQLFDLIKPYRQEHREFSDDYYKVLNFFSLANYPSNNFTFRKVLDYEQVGDADVLDLLETSIAKDTPLSTIDSDIVRKALAKASAVKNIIESKTTIEEKVASLAKQISLVDPKALCRDLTKDGISKEQIDSIEHQEEEAAELEEIQVQQMGAVELMTIVGSKGLSADHVMIIGFDNVNMAKVTRNAFFVAMTRARKSLHVITALKSGGATSVHDFLTNLPDQNLEFSKYTKGNRTQNVLAGRERLISFLQYLNTQTQRH